MEVMPKTYTCTTVMGGYDMWLTDSTGETCMDVLATSWVDAQDGSRIFGSMIIYNVGKFQNENLTLHVEWAPRYNYEEGEPSFGYTVENVSLTHPKLIDSLITEEELCINELVTFTAEKMTEH